MNQVMTMEFSKWAENLDKQVKSNPKYLATGLMIEITEQFYTRMVEKGFSQRELAKRIGKSQPYVAKVLGHGTNMTLETIALFAEALELEVFAPRFCPKERLLPGKTVSFDEDAFSTIIHYDFVNKTEHKKEIRAKKVSESQPADIDESVEFGDTDEIADAS